MKRRLLVVLTIGTILITQNILYGEELTGDVVEETLTSERESQLEELIGEKVLEETIDEKTAVPIVGSAQPWTPWDSYVNGLKVLDSGKCGDNLRWELRSGGYLIISGTGAIYDYGIDQPWAKYSDVVTNVLFDVGVTEISQGVFYDFYKLENVYFSQTVKRIWNVAFQNCYGIKTIVFTGEMPELIYPFGNVKGTVYYPDTWSEIPAPGDYGLNSNWISYALSSLPERYRSQSVKQLSAVTGLSAKAAGLNKVQLSWNASSGADGYLVLGLNKNRTGKQIGYTVKTSWTDIGADSTSWNYYWVIPFYKDEAGTIIQGKLSKYVYALGRTIGKVTSVTTRATKDGVNLSWSSADNANAYVVLSKTGSPTAAYNLPYTTTGRDITDTKAKTGQVIYYWVYAVYCDYVGRVLVAGPVSPFAWAVAK